MTANPYGAPAFYGSGPEIPPWMLSSPDPVQLAAEGLRGTAAVMHEVAGTLQRLVGNAGAALGWYGAAADASSARAALDGSRLIHAADVLVRAATGLEDLATGLRVHGPPLRSLREQRAGVDSSLSVTSFALDPTVGASSVQVEELDRQIRAHMAALEDIQARVAGVLRPLRWALGDVARQAATETWVSDLNPPAISAFLAGFGVLPDAAEDRLLSVMLLAPPGAAGAELLRRELDSWDVDRIAGLLVRHPELAERLTPFAIDVAPPGRSLDERFRKALIHSWTLGDSDAAMADVRRFFAGLDRDDARRLALLFPGVVGNLDGAPLPVRVEANRVNIAAALNAERRANETLEGTLVDRQVVGRSPEEITKINGELSRSNGRLELYQKLLYEHVTNDFWREGRETTVGHQVLVFDPRGDGQIAELWGDIDNQTKHVGILVPGTSTEMANFAKDSDRAYRLALSDKTHGTSVIAWLGTDMPDTISEAANPHYAQDGALKLRDFYSGLELPASADTTVVGHSYGGSTVGLAEAAGMHPTRIFQVESAGTGYGVDHLSAEDLSRTDHYTMTAPGDFIGLAQGAAKPSAPFGLGHGADPDTTPGFTRLDTGRFDDGTSTPGGLIHGKSSHWEVFNSGTTSFKNVAQVIRGGQVTLYSPPEFVYPQYPGDQAHTEYPYENPAFQGPTEDIP